jgi:hypothetical protein
MAQSDNSFGEQLALWEQLKTSANTQEVAAFLDKYPTGYFSELAEERLDILLAKGGEKKIQIAIQKENPFSKGTVLGLGSYSIGDSYSFEVRDIISGVLQDKFDEKVTAITDEGVVFNQGERLLDMLGNELKSPHPRFLSPVQFYPVQYSVGHKWKTRFNWLNRLGVPGEVDMEFKVAKRDTKTMPFGDFNAFYIESWGKVSNGGTITMKYWIDPELCNRPLEYLLQTKTMGGRIGENKLTVLTAYQQKKFKATS